MRQFFLSIFGKERNFFIFIFFLAFLLRMLFIILYPNHSFLENRIFCGDGEQYDNIALNLISGKGFVLYGYPTLRRVPVYPIFLGLIYFLFGHNFVVVRISQAIIGSLTCIIVYLIGKRIFGKNVGLTSALIATFYYSFIQLSAYLVSETLFIFLLMTSVLCLLREVEKPSLKDGIISGILLGITAFCRPVILGLIPLISLWILITFKERALLNAIIIIIFFAITISPWTIRNYIVHHQFIPLTVHFGELLYKGNSPQATGGTGGWNSAGVDYTYPQGLEGLSEVERDKELGRRAFIFMKTQPQESLKLAFKKFFNMWRPYYSNTRLLSKIVMVSSYGLVVILGIAGMIWSGQNWRQNLLFYLILFYYIAIHILTIGVIRYRYPVIPFLVIFAAYSLNFLFKRYPNLWSFS